MSIGADEATRRFERCPTCNALIDPAEGFCRQCGKGDDVPDIERTQVLPVVRAPPSPSGQVVASPPPAYPPRRSAFAPALVVVLGLTAAGLVYLAGSRIDFSRLAAEGAPGGVAVGTSATPKPDPGNPAPLKAATAGPAGVAVPPPGTSPQPGASPGATGAAPGGTLVVANTGGDGVYIRRTPRLSDRIVAWPDGARMQDLGEQATGDGQTWRKVRDPRGNVGYIPSQWLAPEQRRP